MAQQVTVLAARPGDLNSVPEIHGREDYSNKLCSNPTRA